MKMIAQRKALVAAALLFAVFVVNLIVGKVAVLGGATVVPGLGDVGEFLVLLAAVVLFMVACLEREAAAENELANKTKD